MFFGSEVGFWAFTPAATGGVVRDIQYSESLAESTTTSTSYVDKATLTFTPEANTDYIFFWSCDCIALSATDDVYVDFTNTTDSIRLSEQNQENRTTAGAPYKTAHGIAKYSAGGSPASTTFKIRYRQQSVL